MNETTHALYIKDNWDGEGDTYWTFAYKVDGVFYHEQDRSPVLEYEGDEILKEVKL